ncbi:MAG TPA: response regulator [Candidatus Methylomirabilis sp.]|nr:response regulator [Candidatus Methylomirabilis sp.]
METWRILVADDEQYVLLAVKQVLQSLPASVLEAPDGEQALRLAKAKHPDLIILDIKMPRMDGFKVAEALKQDPTTAEIPVIFLSALRDSHVKVRGLVLGAEDYIAKPIDPEELKTRVRVVLRRVRPPVQETPVKEGQIQLESLLPETPVKGGQVKEGQIQVGTLASLVRTLEGERRTARLLLTRGTERGEIVFVDGHIAQAVAGARGGETAVHHLLTWQEGKYELAPHDPSSQIGGEVAAPNQGLLLEGLRRLNEIPGLRARLPGPKLALEVPAALHVAVQQHAPAEAAMLVALLDGSRDLDRVLIDSPYDAWTTLKMLQRLVAVGAIEKAVAGVERRGGPRLKVEVPIEYQIAQPFQQAASFNLSTWGVFIRTTTPLGTGERVMLRFCLPGHETQVTVMGQVVWHNLDPNKWGGAGMGIRFVDLSAADHEAIEGHLAQQIASQLSGVVEHS